jgi:cold shock protein
MKNGTVKFYNYSKGYGFINDSSTGEDIFVHSSGLKDEIRDGDKVTFDVTDGRKGLNAVNVQVSQ